MTQSVFPIPKSSEMLSGVIPRPASIRITSDRDTFRSIEKSLKFANSIIGHEVFLSALSDETSYPVQITLSRDLAAQSYELTLQADSGYIQASSDAGVFYALITFAQLYRNSSDAIEARFIKDSPDLLDRGFMLDISRCKIPKLQTLFDLIDRLALLKYNQLQLYMEHTFAYTEHETVWKEASPYSAEDIQAIDQYCADRFIELVPNQNSFGHLERWLKHSEYKHLAECPDGYTHPLLGPLDHGGTLKPDQTSINFIEELHDELLPNFSSDRFNIGCDETWELGLGWSKPLADKLGKRSVYLEYLKSISKSVVERNLRPQFWGDIILEQPELVEQLPSELSGVVWGYEADHPFEEQLPIFEKAGLDFLVAPGTSSWNSIGGRWTNAKANIEASISLAIKHGASGMLLTDWGDRGHHQPYVISLPAIVLAGGLSWNRIGNSECDPIDTTASLFFDSNSRNVIARALKTLGDIYLKAGTPIHNASLLNKILFATRDQMKDLAPNLNERGLEEAIVDLEVLLPYIQNVDSNDNFTRTSLARLALATEILLFAAEKGLRYLRNEIHPNWESDRIDSLATEFRKLWLEDNRPGGLEESSNRLFEPLP